jgi:hypothetical protein
METSTIVKDGLRYRVVYSPMHRREELSVVGFQLMLSPCLRIPESVNGLPVTSVKEYAFNGNNNIQALEFPDSLEYFEDRCFSGCKNLKKVSCYKTKNTAQELIIFHQVFAKCEGLETFQSTAPVSIFYEGFYGCTNLKNILAPIKGIGTRAFFGSPTCSLKFSDDALWCKGSFDGLKNLKDIRFMGKISKDTCKTYLKDVKKKKLTLYVDKDNFNYLEWAYEGINIIC